MRSTGIRVFVFFWFWVFVLAAGLPNPASARANVVEGEIQFEGKKEPCPPEAAAEECPATFGPIITDTAIPIETSMFAIQPTFGLSLATNDFSPSWRRISAGGDFQSYGMSLKFTYGLWHNLEVYVVVPYIHNWASNVDEPGPNGERSADFGGLGDINLTFKYLLVPEGPVAPAISAIFSPTFPSGHFRHLNPARLGTDAIGGGTYAFTTGFNASKYLKPFILYGNLWYTFQTDYSTDDVDEQGNPIERRNHPRDFVTVNLAAEYPLTPKWVALMELVSTWDGGRLVGPKANADPTALLSVVPGIEYMATDKFSLALGVQIDLVGKDTTANVTPLLSMVYAF
ncbi:MAG: transporter [Deltaproteobacteria bacterium]|jgi:hypothetical protein